MIRLAAVAACGFAMLATVARAQTTQPTWQSTPSGELILRPFASAPYPHSSRAYTDSTVGIVIPSGYVPGETVNYVVHFHGHKNHVSKVLDQFKLAQQLAAAKANAILLVPQGPKDAADSGGGKLELDPGAFAKLIDEVTAYLNGEGKLHTTKVGRIVLSAHSGGYKVTAAILHQGGMEKNITDVLLLDASYGSLEWFAEWCKADSSHRLISLFTDHLAVKNNQLMALLVQSNVRYRVLEEEKLPDNAFTARGPLFMHTKGPHDQVPIDYFGRLLPAFDDK